MFIFCLIFCVVSTLLTLSWGDKGVSSLMTGSNIFRNSDDIVFTERHL